jgi:hypothetical protein
MPISVLQREDSPPTWIEPLAIKLIEQAMQACHASNMEIDMAIANMITIGFSFYVILVNTH